MQIQFAMIDWPSRCSSSASTCHSQAYPESRTLLGRSGAIVQMRSDFRAPCSNSSQVSTLARPHYRSVVGEPFALQTLDDLEYLHDI